MLGKLHKEHSICLAEVIMGSLAQEIRLIPHYSPTICFAFAASLLAAFTADISRTQADPLGTIGSVVTGQGIPTSGAEKKKQQDEIIRRQKERERQNQDALKRDQQKKDELNTLQAEARREEERKQKEKEAYQQGVGKIHKSDKKQSNPYDAIGKPQKNAKSPQANPGDAIKNRQNTPAADAMTETSNTKQMRLQMQMDRRSKSISTISNVQKKSSETSTQINSNMK
jgi:hypothetical protein